MDYYIFVPVEKLKKYKSNNHHKKRGWVKFYYYRNFKRTHLPHYLINKKVVELYRIYEARNDTFYKDHQLSERCNVFDYYKVLKEKYRKDKEVFIPKPSIVPKNKRGKNKLKIPEKFKDLKKSKSPFILRFD